ncbi:MAG: TlpA disulfide reductase family protein [Pirellulaceae bacterium]|nr:TlpA disulfide reductase family protein [Pirellulaceae bacterium]
MPSIYSSRSAFFNRFRLNRTQVRRALLVACGVGVAASATFSAAVGADPSEKLSKALAFKPRQADVNYEQVKPEQMADCSLEETVRDDGKGFLVTGPGAVPLRWFADTNGDNRLDRWCYYNAGVEVYRESDTDFNETADEYRWLSTEGLRWGKDKDEDGTIDAWNMISAEEVTAEVVRATANREPGRFERLLITDAEIASLGLGKEKADLLVQRVADARKQFAAWTSGQNVVTKTSKWTNFGGDKPGIVPAGTEGSKKDIVVYENVVALLEDAGKAKQLLVGTIIQVGPTWRLVDLPKTVAEGQEVSDSGVFFSASFQPRGASGVPEAPGGLSKAMERLVADLQKVDEKLNSPKLSASDKVIQQSLRADAIEKLVSASSGEERSSWIRQFADTVSASAQAGEFPEGVDRLYKFVAKLNDASASQNDIAYVVFRTLTADNNIKMQDPKANFDALQKANLADLESFIEKYPTSEEAAEAMIQIALSAEFSGDAKLAEKWYTQAAKDFSKAMAGKKAAGALRRLNLVGRNFGLEGQLIDGRDFSSKALQGGPVVYHCWASWCQGCIAEMRGLKELQNKYSKTKLKIVGINFDNNQKQAADFLTANPFPWMHLYDEGGLDSTVAVAYGILTLPVNVIVDKNGKVVKTGVHWTEIDGIIEELVKSDSK